MLDTALSGANGTFDIGFIEEGVYESSFSRVDGSDDEQV